MQIKNTFKSMEELNKITFPEPTWIVEGLLMEGGISILAGEAKAGKSTFSRQLMSAVSNGDSFLNRNTTKTKVYYFCLEDRISKVRNSLNVLDCDLNNIFITEQKISNTTAFFKEFNDGESKLIVLDTMVLNISFKDLNDYNCVTTVLEPYRTFAKETNSHILMLHHMGKNKEQSDQNKMIGSVGLAGAVETMLFLGKNEGNKSSTFGTSLRYGDVITGLQLDFDAKSEIFSIAPNQSQPVESLKPVDLRQRVLEYLKDAQVPVSKSQLKNDVKGKSSYIVEELISLTLEQLIIQTGDGCRANPHFYSLPLGEEREQGTESQSVESVLTLASQVATSTGGSNA